MWITEQEALAGRFTYRVRFGKYKDMRTAEGSVWSGTAVWDCGSDELKARAVAAGLPHIGHCESACVEAHDELGRKVFWIVRTDSVGGGGASVPYNTPTEARVAWARARASDSVAYAELLRCCQNKYDTVVHRKAGAR